MDAEKIRNLTGDELLLQQHDLNDQLFRLKFQLKMGQTESLNKIRGLRKDVARIQTVMREKQLGSGREGKATAVATPAAAPPAAKVKPAAKPKPAAKSKIKPAAKTRKK